MTARNISPYMEWGAAVSQTAGAALQQRVVSRFVVREWRGGGAWRR